MKFLKAYFIQSNATALKSVFCRKIDTQTDDFNPVLKIIGVFLTKPFTVAVEGKEFTEKWSATDGEWM